ncbi:hypothetical protein VBJ04_10985 [Enterobacter hormaechei]|uniref:hypothetical protein n=1 Tax=Enterobacter cloacae complex TaxID=354276 RepID=UPI000F887A93|nr:hypothetical protein [Enterobacter hormaechei]EKV4773208.1 hypothetical protein [Enterobacter hormaechei]ELJ9633282.1 hypothetical protein [Enterobacter hormaechei]ELJ9636366.1 hypothetical protein [Enterobacter hormaechei]ELW9319248.1 hypothetical protein [Enterobacter hormaechei]ELW9322329.1 hypothetical protein [Enterobacter hormaechei]
MARTTQEQLMDILTLEDIELNRLRKPDGIAHYKSQLFLLLSSDTVSINALAKLSWHTAATIKKELVL